MGDFYQFAPINGLALWENVPASSEIEQRGKYLWNSLTAVMTLTQQMRQHTDTAFRNLLGRARTGSLTQSDVNTLNQQVATDLSTMGSLTDAVFTQTNNVRHTATRIQVPRFNEAHKQEEILFPAEHSRTTRRKKFLMQDEDLLMINDGKDVNSPGLLSYSKGMPVTILTNQCTPLGIVNGARGTMDQVIVLPEGACIKVVVPSRDPNLQKCSNI